MWYHAVPLENKRPQSCIKAFDTSVVKIRCEFEGARVVYRIHGDRASELTGEQVCAHFEEQHLTVSCTPGFERNANGKAEKGVGLIKQRARAMLLGFPSMVDRQALWPCADQHATWCSRMAAGGRRTNFPAFGVVITSRIKDLPSSMFAERAVDGCFLGVDEGSAWLIGRKDRTAEKPGKVWIIESFLSFVAHPPNKRVHSQEEPSAPGEVLEADAVPKSATCVEEPEVQPDSLGQSRDALEEEPRNITCPACTHPGRALLLDAVAPPRHSWTSIYRRGRGGGGREVVLRLSRPTSWAHPRSQVSTRSKRDRRHEEFHWA